MVHPRKWSEYHKTELKSGVCPREKHFPISPCPEMTVFNSHFTHVCVIHVHVHFCLSTCTVHDANVSVKVSAYLVCGCVSLR